MTYLDQMAERLFFTGVIFLIGAIMLMVTGIVALYLRPRLLSRVSSTNYTFYNIMIFAIIAVLVFFSLSLGGEALHKFELSMQASKMAEMLRVKS